MDRGDGRSVVHGGGQLVAEDVEAVGAVGHEASEPDGPERSRDAAGRLAKRRLLAHPARRVARASLGGPQDGKIDARRLQEAGGGPGDPPPVGIEGAGTSDPVEDLGRLAGPEHANTEIGRPCDAIRRRAAERVAALHGRLERPGRGGVDEAGLDESATQIDELVQNLDLERTRSDARGARRAGPGLLGADEVSSARPSRIA